MGIDTVLYVLSKIEVFVWNRSDLVLSNFAGYGPYKRKIFEAFIFCGMASKSIIFVRGLTAYLIPEVLDIGAIILITTMHAV